MIGPYLHIILFRDTYTKSKTTLFRSRFLILYSDGSAEVNRVVHGHAETVLSCASRYVEIKLSFFEFLGLQFQYATLCFFFLP